MMNCLAVQMCVPILIQSISLRRTQKTKKSRKTASMMRVPFTTHMEIRVTYCSVVALSGSWGGAEKAQVMKKANSAAMESFKYLTSDYRAAQMPGWQRPLLPRNLRPLGSFMMIMIDDILHNQRDLIIIAIMSHLDHFDRRKKENTEH